MISRYFDSVTERTPVLAETGMQLARVLHTGVLRGGHTVRSLIDVLHGTWLSHPLHPMLTDVAIGAWTMGALFDIIAIGHNSRQTEHAADTLTTVGAIAAVPTAIAGLADYSTIPKGAAGSGFLHALLNSLALILYLFSLRDRKNGDRGRAVSFSAAAYSLLLFSAWIGGHLVYKHRVGVNHTEPASKPEEWQAIMAENELHEQEPRRVEVVGSPVLLYRYGGTIYATAAVCGHAGGPLEQGQFDEYCVQCPWHDSVYDLRDGSIVHGPTTYTLPKYAARIQNGQVEIRAEWQ
jgi:nitrite reductase/ring-hydroxylating ferredoxin subunit/uncharacterized membrane protein